MRTEHTCPKCNETKPADQYQKYKGNPNGWCRSCRSACEAKRRISKGIKPKKLAQLTDIGKNCLDCGRDLPLDMFYASKRGLGGRATKCKDCMVAYRLKRAEANPGAARKASKKSREKNLERSRLLGRMKQRRRLGKTTWDVPKELKTPVLNSTHCYYCGEFIKYKGKFDKDKNIRPNFRTIDHKIPVDRGGDNSPENLVMACNCCNSSKRNKTSEEYFEWKIKNNK